MESVLSAASSKRVYISPVLPWYLQERSDSFYATAVLSEILIPVFRVERENIYFKNARELTS